jgi:hypothetical protein
VIADEGTCPRFEWPAREQFLRSPHHSPTANCAHCFSPRARHRDTGLPLPPDPVDWVEFRVLVERLPAPRCHGVVEHVTTIEGVPVGLWVRRPGRTTIFIPWTTITAVAEDA